jgi:hypothetical protein
MGEGDGSGLREALEGSAGLGGSYGQEAKSRGGAHSLALLRAAFGKHERSG